MERFEKDRPGFPRAKQSFAAYQDFRRFILVDDRDGVKIITIRRPQAMNALNDELTDEILGVLKQYADDPAVKGFIITGYGTAAFSAGADIGKFPSMLGDPAAAAQYARDCAKVKCNFAISRNNPRHIAGHRWMCGAVSQMAPGCGFVSRHDLPRQAADCERSGPNRHGSRAGGQSPATVSGRGRSGRKAAGQSRRHPGRQGRHT
ncbi:MAG: enoyl-CoA hydratase/isomerase family protein [Desulfobacterales bacterium]